MVRHATNALNIEANVTITADKFVASDQDVDVQVFDDMSNKSILDILKGRSARMKIQTH